jgi:peptide chain release factor 3
VTTGEPAKLEDFARRDTSAMCTDLDGDPVYLATSAFSLKYEEDRWDMLKFVDVKDYQKG